MTALKLYILVCGQVFTSPYLPFNPHHVGLLKVAGFGVPKEELVYSPVMAYYIEHPKGNLLVDAGWNRRISPNGTLDKKAQIAELGYLLYRCNKGYLPEGKAVHEQLATYGIKPSDLDYVILTHLDCDHACGVDQVAGAKHIMVSQAEWKAAKRNIFRYKKRWWNQVKLETFTWNDTQGPFGRSFDLFGDGSVELIHLPGHAKGQVAVKITNTDGRYVLLTADGAYSTKSWKEMILPGIYDNRKEQLRSLQWIRDMSLSPQCIETLSSHDADITPHVIEW